MTFETPHVLCVVTVVSLVLPGGSADMGMGPFGQQGQPGQSPNWPDTVMGMDANRFVQTSSSVFSREALLHLN